VAHPMDSAWFCFFRSRVAQAIRNCKAWTFIIMSVREELWFLLHVFKDPTTYSWSAAIATLIEWKPDFHSWQDAFLSGAGGFSFDQQLWWMVKWSPTIANCTIQFLSKGNRHLVSINILEYAAIIIGLAYQKMHYLI
jgi:hypothetical protein